MDPDEQGRGSETPPEWVNARILLSSAAQIPQVGCCALLLDFWHRCLHTFLLFQCALQKEGECIAVLMDLLFEMWHAVDKCELLAGQSKGHNRGRRCICG